MVRQCQPPGLLSSVVHISLVGEDESVAQGLLLNGLNAKRAKPAQRPSFPGAGAGRPHKAFPGPASPSGAGLAPYVPNLKRSPTDADRRRFSRQAFEVIKAHFQMALDQLAQHSDPVEMRLPAEHRDGAHGGGVFEPEERMSLSDLARGHAF